MNSRKGSLKASTAETQAVLDSIRRIVRGLRISSRATERGLGLSSAQLFVLQKLSDGNAVSLNGLASRTLTHQSSVSVVVAKLAAQGLVRRRRSKEDERRIDISITPKGLGLLGTAPEPVQERLVAAIERLPAARRRALVEGLELVVRESGLEQGPAPLFFEEK